MSESHLLNLLFYSVCVSVFFAFLLKEERRDRLMLALKLFGVMAGGSFALGWLMHPFP